jgi:hypothetical protein
MEVITRNPDRDNRPTMETATAARHKGAKGTVCPGTNKNPVKIPGIPSIRNCAENCGAQFRWSIKGENDGIWKCITPGRIF